MSGGLRTTVGQIHKSFDPVQEGVLNWPGLGPDDLGQTLVNIELPSHGRLVAESGPELLQGVLVAVPLDLDLSKQRPLA